MKLRWTPRAVADLEEISDYLMAASPQTWEHLLQRLEHLTDALLDFPLMGKSGPGTGHARVCAVGHSVHSGVSDETGCGGDRLSA